jgi:HSP20 family protein
MNEKKALAKAAAGPFGLLRQMTSELDRMFDDPWTFRWPALQVDNAMWAPKVDVVEKDNRLITRVDLPGVKKEDVSVEVTDGQLILSGERKSETEKKNNGKVYRAECEYGSFYRAVPLPEGVKPEDVKATFANGVLEVSLPLPAPAKTIGKKIPIQSAA